MSNIFRVLRALASANGACIGYDATQQIISLIGGDAEPTVEGVKLVQDSLRLLQQETQHSSYAFQQTRFQDHSVLSADRSRLSTSELFTKPTKPFYCHQPHEDIKPVVYDPVSPSKFRTPKTRLATIEHSQRMQLARVKKQMEQNFQSARMQGEACYSYKKQAKFSYAASVFPELEQTYRELRQSKWL